MPRAYSLVIVGSIGLLCGCNDSTSPTGASNEGVTLQLVKQQGYLATLAGLKGKIVVVDLWGQF